MITRTIQDFIRIQLKEPDYKYKYGSMLEPYKEISSVVDEFEDTYTPETAKLDKEIIKKRISVVPGGAFIWLVANFRIKKAGFHSGKPAGKIKSTSY
jgi:hypothetical protein